MENKEMPASEAVKINSNVKKVVEDLNNEKIFPCSPFPEMYEEWSDEDKLKLDIALQEIIREENK